MKLAERSIVMSIMCLAGLLFFSCGILDSESDDVNRNDIYAKEPFNTEIDVENRVRLSLEGINGNITVVGQPNASKIIINGEKQVGSESLPDAEQHMANLEVRINQLTEMVAVKTIQPKETRGRNYVVNYELTVPSDFELILINVNGNVTVDANSNSLIITNVNGNIELDAISGDVTATLVNGNIQNSMTLRENGTAKMVTVNGNLALDIPKATSGQLTATLVNGTISTNNIEMSNVQQTKTRLDAKLGAGNGNIELTTVNGGISINGK